MLWHCVVVWNWWVEIGRQVEDLDRVVHPQEGTKRETFSARLHHVQWAHRLSNTNMYL